METLGRIGRKHRLCAICGLAPVHEIGDVCILCRQKQGERILEITIRNSDLNHEQPIERALSRSLLENGLSDFDFVHHGSDELGFSINGERWESKLTPLLSQWLYDVAFGQRTLPISKAFLFKRLSGD